MGMDPFINTTQEVTIHAPNNACTTNNPYRIHYAISCLSLSSFFFINSMPCWSSSLSFWMVFFIFLSWSVLRQDYMTSTMDMYIVDGGEEDEREHEPHEEVILEEPGDEPEVLHLYAEDACSQEPPSHTLSGYRPPPPPPRSRRTPSRRTAAAAAP